MKSIHIHSIAAVYDADAYIVGPWLVARAREMIMSLSFSTPQRVDVDVQLGGTEGRACVPKAAH